ncbi:MAG: alpha/beta hydrolase [Pseudomonadota bacterium]
MRTWKTGIFSNDMAWSSVGDGNKVVIMIPGGPGNPTPGKGFMAKLEAKTFEPLLSAGYRLVNVARRRNMPHGHSVADMAQDYADMIAVEFNGRVDLIVGTSYGGIIAQYLAANHDNCFDNIVILVAACDISPEKAVDYAFAKSIAEGKTFAAGAELSKTLFPGARFPWLARLAGGLMIWLTIKDGQHEYLASDVMVEAEAEMQFNSRAILPKINVPVLLIAGDKDVYFTEALTLETQMLIPDCQLQMYADKGHVEAASDSRAAEDILTFIAR